MRHLWSLLAGVVATPLTWGLLALGQSRSLETVTGWVQRDAFDTTDLIEPAVYLAVAGVLLGLIATLRISPLGPLVAGLLLTALYGGMFVSPLDVRNAVPDNWEILDRQLPLRLPLDNGTLLFVAALLLVATFSAQRWRQWPATAVAAGSAEGEQPAGPGTPVTAGGPVGSDELFARPAPVTPPTPGEPVRTGDEPGESPSGGDRPVSAPPSTGDVPAPRVPAEPTPDKSPERVSAAIPNAEPGPGPSGPPPAGPPPAWPTPTATEPTAKPAAPQQRIGESRSTADRSTSASSPAESPWAAPPSARRNKD